MRGAGLAPAARHPLDRAFAAAMVAAHLKRDVRTAQRWERREGLPVHRHEHDRQASVYAFRGEVGSKR